MKIVINALQYKQNSSGIGVMIRDLFGAYTKIVKQPCEVVVPNDAPPFPAGDSTKIISIPWRHGQGLRRLWFQTVQLGRHYGKNAVLLTTDSKIPFFLFRCPETKRGGVFPLPIGLHVIFPASECHTLRKSPRAHRFLRAADP